jgi:hypothetical protein
MNAVAASAEGNAIDPERTIWGPLTSINTDLARCAFKDYYAKGMRDDGHLAILRSRPAKFLCDPYLSGIGLI